MSDGVTYWYGRATGSWWAVARDGAGRWRLVEAASQAELGRRLTELGVRPDAARSRFATPLRPPAGSAAAWRHRY
jgi:hypothetical protein